MIKIEEVVMQYVNERIAKRIEEVALMLTGELSVVDTLGEVAIAHKVYDFFGNMD